MRRALPALETRHTIGELTYRAIRKAILSRRLPAGTRLVVDRLCEELKVSRTPVKQALAMLEREGLVVTNPHHGTYVVTITKRDIAEIYSLREVIEGMAARLAAETITRQDLQRLRALIQDGRKALEAKDFDAYAEIDLEFHRLIRRASGNQRLQRIMESLDGQVRILINTSAA
ncbi:MAG: GntR family transcriptional regulator, partial [Armatimonadota bacterium]|nr:GntR family transcriptional regulator [Armatimonadota bacterium]